MPAELENTCSNSSSADAGHPSPVRTQPPLPSQQKKKRSLPGMPDPDAEVIALSPKTLLATNRFICEICNKGFQRDQNLQLHRRGHNLPWKLRQRSPGNEPRKRVYVCPEPSCVHHDPTRALGDLTGIKKHFCRKHGEKKWKCEKCSKKYAVQSDWKAHSKTCGTREYRCDCGTLFSRRDSFITHRAFCDALAEESARAQIPAAGPVEESKNEDGSAATAPPPKHFSPPASDEQEPEAAAATVLLKCSELCPAPPVAASSAHVMDVGSCSSANTGTSGSSSLLANLFASTATRNTHFPDLMVAGGGADHLLPVTAMELPSLCLSNNASGSVYAPPRNATLLSLSPHMSATALLQKAAQLGATSCSSFLQGFGLEMSSPTISSAHHHLQQWDAQVSSTPTDAVTGLGLPQHDSAAGGMPDLMLGGSVIFNARPTTLDFLGLEVNPAAAATSGAATSGGSSAMIVPIGSGVNTSGASIPFTGGIDCSTRAVFGKP